MNKYFATISAGAGMKTWIVVYAPDVETAEEEARGECIEWAESFGYKQDEDFFGDLDQLGKEWNNEEEGYSDVSELEYYAVPYDSEKHKDWL